MELLFEDVFEDGSAINFGPMELASLIEKYF